VAATALPPKNARSIPRHAREPTGTVSLAAASDRQGHIRSLHLRRSAQRLASTIARMPARTAGGRLDQASTT
jgi:hypothetical protein